MIKHYITAVLAFTSLTACNTLNSTTSIALQAQAEAAKSNKDAQVAYFTCLAGKQDLTDCRQAVWNQHPLPKVEGEMTREFLLAYLGAMEMRGAGQVLQDQHYTCPSVTTLTDQLFNSGYRITCSNGVRYQLDRHENAWMVQTIKETGV